jgi:pilus assembly protein FimV
MLAIQDVNPDAFIDGNINKMKEGVVLRMPTPEQMTSRSKYDAVNAVIAQNEALRPTRSKSIVSTTQPEGPSAVSNPAPDPRDELKLVVANSGASQSSSAHSGTSEAGSGTASKEELALTLEKLDQAVSEKKELSGRVEDLEEQLETLQRLLTLKNDQLAGIQEQMRANAAAEEAQVGVTESVAAVTEPVADQTMTATEPVADATASVAETPAVTESGAEMPEADVAAQAETPAEAPAPKPVVQKPAQVEEEKPVAKSFVEKLFTDPLYMAIASIGILVLMVLVWLVSRSNARKEQALRTSTLDDQENLFSDAPRTHANASDFSADADAALDEAEQASDQDALAAGESKRADVIAEADVYIAYGRLDRAADILEQAIGEEPLRTDLRLKLLEVYKESGSKQDFERQFSELEAIRDASAIALATQLRNELFDRELLSLEDDDFALTEEDFKAGSTDTQSLLDEGSLADEVRSARAPESDLEREVLDSFDFDQADKIDLEEPESEIDFDAEDIDLDIDVSNEFEDERDESFESGLSLDLDEELEADKRRTVESVESESVREFDLSDDLAELETDEQTHDTEIDLDLSDIELSDELEQEKEIDIPEDLSIPDELADITSVKQAAVAPVVSDDILQEAEDAFKEVDDLDADLGDEEEFDFLEGADEASTKLDLARAYIDMGDLDGARDILEEVCKEGNADQQKEAKVLLDELDE